MVEQIKDVSIILPIFKGCKDLKNISSILNQSYRNYELIIIDDGADLDTQNILNAIKARYKKVVLIKNKKNLGLPKSLNRAIKKSKFNLIFRMDADDFALKDRILEQIRFLKKTQILIFWELEQFTEPMMSKKRFLCQEQIRILKNH